jgi:FtsH-binding integral membrane protein
MMIASNRLDSGLIGILPALVVASMTHAITESDVLDRNINWVLIVIFTVSTTPDLAAIKSRLVARCQPPRSPTMATRLTPNTVALLKPPSNGQQDTG